MPSRVQKPQALSVPASDSGPAPGTDPDVTLAAIDALYGFAERPAAWEQMLHAIESLPGGLDPDRDAAAAQISSHAQRAAALAERLNQSRRHASPAASWDAVLLSTEGRVRAVTGAAQNRLAPFATGDVTLGAHLTLKPKARDAFTAAFDGVAKPAAKSIAPFSLSDIRSPARLLGVVIARDAFPAGLTRAFGLDDVWAEPLVAVVLLSQQDQPPLNTLAQDVLGLTAAEARLASRLAAGRQITQASEDLGISPHTARTQLKMIFAKTGVRRQSELIGILNRIQALGSDAIPLSRGAQFASPPRRFITLSDGRKLFYREYGSPQGAPVMYLHTGLAASLIRMDLPEAAKGRLRVLAPERPGFGQSTPAQDLSFAGVTRDLDEFAAQLNLKSVALIGDGTGGAYALHAAMHAITPVRALALRAPRLLKPQKHSGGAFQSAMSALVRQPWLVRSVLDIVRRGAEMPLLQAMANRFYSSPADRARLKNDEAIKALQAQMADGLEVSSAGVAAEMKLFQNLPQWNLSPLNCPTAIWIGAENGLLQINETSTLLAQAQHATIHILPGVGVVFPRQAWEEIVEWVR
jgi:pimeloyl-ACP methyl ester carboxylesterase/DNA-binding CsgD family transcriptional regulator